MKYAWAYDETYISELVTASADGWINGTAMRHEKLVAWTAQAQPQGYYVVVSEGTGRQTSGHPGGTFNLMLEVASQVKRAIV